MEFDEKAGQLLNQQVSFEQQKATARAALIEVPWKCWYNENLNVAATAADKAAIVNMLESIHRRWDASAVGVQMILNSTDKKISVVASANMPAKSLYLPACVPRGCKVHDLHNEHPMAVSVSVALADGTNNSVKAGDGAPANAARQIEYPLCPEFKAPTAVAANPGEGQDAQQLIYSRDNSESLHPFWAVRRIDKKTLTQERQAVLDDIQRTGESLNVPQFNCEIVTKVHPAMCIASLGEKAVSSTRFVSVPFMTNSKDVVQGEELICELVVRPKPKKALKIVWQDVAKEEDKQKAARKEKDKS